MDQIQSLQQSKQRNYDKKTLNARLRMQIELSLESQAQDEAIACHSESNAQEMEEILKLHETEITNFKSYKEELQDKLKIEQSHQNQNNNEMANNEKIIKVIKDHYSLMDDQYKTLNKEYLQIKSTTEEQTQNYEKMKKQFLATIAKSDNNLSNIDRLLQLKQVEYENDVKYKEEVLQQLTGKLHQVTDELVRQNNNYNDLKSEYKNNTEQLNKLHMGNDALKNIIKEKKAHLIELEKNKLTLQENYNSNLNDLRGKLNQSTDRLEDLNRIKVDLQKKLVEETEMTRKYEVDCSKFEEEKRALLNINQMLNAEHEEITKGLVQVAEHLNSEQSELDCTLRKSHKELNDINLTRKQKESILYDVQQTLESIQKASSDMLNIEQELKKELVLKEAKLEDLNGFTVEEQVKLERLKNVLIELQRKHTESKESSERQLFELEQKLISARATFEMTKEQSENKIKQLTDELAVYKSDLENVYQENEQSNQQKLQQLQDHLVKERNKLQDANKKLEEHCELKSTLQSKHQLLEQQMNLMQLQGQTNMMSTSLSRKFSRQDTISPEHMLYSARSVVSVNDGLDVVPEKQ